MYGDNNSLLLALFYKDVVATLNTHQLPTFFSIALDKSCPETCFKRLTQEFGRFGLSGPLRQPLPAITQ